MSFKIYQPRGILSAPQKAKEVARVDFRTLRALQVIPRGVVSHRELERVFRDTLLPKLRITQHLRQRLDGYVNTPSKNGRYIELYPHERERLLTLPQWLGDCDLDVVEAGFNTDKEVCKIAVTTNIPEGRSHYVSPEGRSDVTSSGNRTLFLCCGMDGGVKSLYVTPQFKYRQAYGGEVPYLDVPSFLEWVSL